MNHASLVTKTCATYWLSHSQPDHGTKVKSFVFAEKIKVKVEPYALSLIALQKGILCQHKINGL